MIKVRFVEGSFASHSTVYDCDWPVAPRVGEFLSITVGTGQVMDWKVTQICHVAAGDESHIGVLAWIEPAKAGRDYSLDNV